MANPSVTNTFVNGTAIDAAAVNTNFTDLINGATDGTKDYSISALTVAGTATLNGHVNLGNSSADDLSITASLATSLPIKTTASFDIGSTSIGLRALFLGLSTFTTKIATAATVSWVLTLPPTAGSAGQRLETNGSGTTTWVTSDSPLDLVNYSLAASVGSSALTIALKDKGGSDCSATSAAKIGFRSSTASSGVFNTRSVTGALSLTISSGSTLGFASAVAHTFYVYAIDNAGTVELAVSQALFDQGSVVTTTAEGGAGAADSNRVMYSATARTGVPCRLIGRMTATEATAGTWATAPSEIVLWPFSLNKPFLYATNTASTAFTKSVENTVPFAITTGGDNFNSFSGASTYLYTIPETGRYAIAAGVFIGSEIWAVNDQLVLRIDKNSGTYLSTTVNTVQAAFTGGLSAQVAANAPLTAGDTIRIRINPVKTNAADADLNSGGDGNFFTLSRVD